MYDNLQSLVALKGSLFQEIFLLIKNGCCYSALLFWTAGYQQRHYVVLKKIIAYILLSLYFINNEILCQNFDSSETNYHSEKIIQFFNEIDYVCSFYSDSSKWKRDFTKEEIKNLSEQYYDIIANHFIEYRNYLKFQNEQWGNNILKYKQKINRKPAVKFGIIRRKIAEYYSPAFAELLTIPYLLRVKVIRFDESFYYPEDESLKQILKNGRMKQTDMIVKIEDVIKGMKVFNIEDTTTISFFWDWFHGCYNRPKFEINQSYFIPVGIFRIENNNKYQYAIKMLADQNCAIYPIDNEIIKTSGDYFNIGEESNWGTFREYFINNYVLK